MAKTQQKLPNEINNYINSGKAISGMDEIAEKAEIYNVDSLYDVLFELIRKEIPAGEFINEISREIGVDREMSLSIAHEIKEKVLNDIKYDLKNWGVDLEKIETPNPTPLEELSISEMLKSLGIEETEETYEKETPTSPKINKQQDKSKKERKEIPISSSPKSQLKTSTKDKKEKEKEERPKTTPKDTGQESPESKPFMIHQESDFSQKKSNENQSKGKKKRKKSFSFSKDGFFDSNKDKGKKQSPKAQIGTPGSQKKKGGGIFGFGGKKKEKERVVHYSDNRTDLSDDGSNKFINLSNLEPTSPKNKSQKKKKNFSNKNKKNQKNKKPNDASNKIKNKQANKNNSSKGKSFLGNIDESNVNKKDYKENQSKNDKTKEDKGDGPHVDGNTVDLSQN